MFNVCRATIRTTWNVLFLFFLFLYLNQIQCVRNEKLFDFNIRFSFNLYRGYARIVDAYEYIYSMNMCLFKRICEQKTDLLRMTLASYTYATMQSAGEGLKIDLVHCCAENRNLIFKWQYFHSNDAVWHTLVFIFPKYCWNESQLKKEENNVKHWNLNTRSVQYVDVLFYCQTFC